MQQWILLNSIEIVWCRTLTELVTAEEMIAKGFRVWKNKDGKSYWKLSYDQVGLEENSIPIPKGAKVTASFRVQKSSKDEWTIQTL